MEINWHKNVAYWGGQITPTGWVEKYHWKWATNGDFSKLLGILLWLTYVVEEC